MNKITITLLTLLFTGYLHAQNYTINTIAGNGSDAFSGDGGPATNAGLNIQGVAIDTAGNIYIGDWLNNRIRKIDKSGTITTFAGNGTKGYSGDGGPATNAELYYPSGVAVDDSGNVFIADVNNNRIRKVNTKGIITTYAGNGTAGYSGNGGLATAAELNYPGGVRIDASNNLYIADVENNCIRKVNTSNIITTIAGNGTAGYSGNGGAATAAELYYPLDVAIDNSGNIFIDDAENYCVRKVDASGIITTFAGTTTYGYGGDGGPATTAEISWPTGVATDAAGSVYIVDSENQRVRKVYKNDTILTIAGNGTMGYRGDGGPATAAELDSSYAIIVDKSNNVYFGDKNVHVRILTQSPTAISEISGNVSQINIYPNPTSENINISLPGFTKSTVDVELEDITGRVIFRKNYKVTDNIVSPIYVGNLAPGIYFANILSGERALQTLKFVKQ